MLLIFCNKITPRVKYIFKFIINEVCGFEFNLTCNESEYKNYTGPSFNYSNQVLKETEVHYPVSSLLLRNDIKSIYPAVESKNGAVTFLFPSENNGNLVFDPFAAAFYLISRYEEYLPFTPDKHDRFEAISSVNFSFGLLRRPLINEWAFDIQQQILTLYPSLFFFKKKFSTIISIDIDQAFAFKNRGILRNLLSFTRNLILLKKDWLKEQILVELFSKNDPFNTYSYLQKIQRSTGLSFIFFINVGKYSKYDKNLNINNLDYKKILKQLNDEALIGLHPSYYSSNIPKKLLKEKRNLEGVLNKTVLRSRQHYLKINLPKTYRNLLEAGIYEDYSMGYASHPGFRAGTCTPFFWFDLENNCETQLKVFPITFMEGTLAEDLGLSPIEALPIINELIEIVARYNGCFVPVWHNHTINDYYFWKGWKDVFEQMIEKVKTEEFERS